MYEKDSCGHIRVRLFLQTGTLTEEGLDVWGVMEGGPAGFSELLPEPRLLPPGPMLSGLACSHTVTLLRGQPLGDPLELKMVESTGWVRHYKAYFIYLKRYLARSVYCLNCFEHLTFLTGTKTILF